MNSVKKILLQHYKAWLAAVFIILMLASCKQQPNPDHQYLQNIFRTLDSSYAIGHPYNTDADMRLIDSAFATVKHPAIADIADRYSHKMLYFWVGPNYDSLIAYADSSIALLQKYPGDDSLAIKLVNALFLKGLCEMKRNNYDEAIRNYTKAKLIFTAGGKDTTNMLRYYDCVGNVLYTQHKYLQAANFFRMHLNLSIQSVKDPCQFFLAKQGGLDNIGECFTKAGMADSAIFYFDAALEYINETKKKPGYNCLLPLDASLAVVYGNKAAALKLKENMKEAEKLFLKSYTLLNTKPNAIYPEFIRYDLVSLAELYFSTGQTKKAAAVLNALHISLPANEISATAARYYKLCSNYYLQTNQVQASNNALQHADYIKDSLNRRDKAFIGIDISRELENKEQEKINETLQKNNEIKNNYLLLAGVGSVLALSIILLAVKNLKRTSRFAKQLGVLNTALKEKNNELFTTLFSLEQSYKENNRIMRVVAHDLKNPVNAVRTLAGTVLKQEQAADKKEMLMLIQSSCTDSMSLIKDLLDSKRSLAAISKELVDMGRLIEQCTELFQAKAQEKNQRISFQVDHTLMMLNRQKIWRVISNIVNNAIKFSPANAEINIQLQRKEESVLISVRDNGIGIPIHLKEKIFTIDPAASREGTAGEESYGLGLSISKKIIEEHAGQLWFESEAGIGSIFYVELPYSVN